MSAPIIRGVRGAGLLVPIVVEDFHTSFKGTLLGTPNREPQEYSRYIIGIYLPGSLYSIIFLLYSWGSPFGVPSRVPLSLGKVRVSGTGVGRFKRNGNI